MLAVDTNLLLRAFLMDEPGVSERAAETLERLRSAGKLYISPFVLLEFVWVLSRRRLPRLKIAELIADLLESEGVIVGSHGVMASALACFRKGKEGFSDYAILADSERAGAQKLLTFDENLCKEQSGCFSPFHIF